MNIQSVILVIHVLIAFGLIGLVLIQHGRGADAGAAFGSGSAGSMFGSRGPASFLTRTTAILAISFFVTSLTLGYLAGHRQQTRSVVDGVEAPPAGMSLPAADVSAVEAPSSTSSDVPQLPTSGGQTQ